MTRLLLGGRADEAGELRKDEVDFYPQVGPYPYYDLNLFFDLMDYIDRMSPSKGSIYQEQLDKVVLYKAVTNPFAKQTISKFCGIATYIPRHEWGKGNRRLLGFPVVGSLRAGCHGVE